MQQPEPVNSVLSPLEMREDCWPDSVRNGHIVANDVSRLNDTVVDRIFQVRSIQDIQGCLREARASGKRVCMRGAKHSMGNKLGDLN
jgi:hypothetical protein